MLSISDVLNLIRLTELELNKLQAEIDGNDDDKKNEAGEVIVQFDTMAKKLKDMYLEFNPNYNIYPSYEEYLDKISK